MQLNARLRHCHPFPAGARVRNYGQQWTQAQEYGTASVVQAFPQHDGTYEYLVQRDELLTPGGDRQTWWASYSTYRAWERLP